MTLLIAIIVFTWAILILLKWYEPHITGKLGENFVSRKLLNLDPVKYEVLDNLMLPSLGNTDTTQIDHVVVSNFGIFVIETKAHTGWIFGNAYHQYWTQVIYRKKTQFYNPLRQNYAHVKAVEALIRPLFPKVPIMGFVAFPSAEKLQISGTDAVGHARDVVSRIKSYTSEVLPEDGKDQVANILFDANIRDKQARKRHALDARAVGNLYRSNGDRDE